MILRWSNVPSLTKLYTYLLASQVKLSTCYNTAMYKSESIAYKLIKEFYGDVEILVNHRPDWLKNPFTGFNLELDFYIPSKSVAYEIQGPHHYKKSDRSQQWRDKYKKQQCEYKRITLVTVVADQRDFYALRNLFKSKIPDEDIQYNFQYKNHPKKKKRRKNPKGKPSQYGKIVQAHEAQRRETESVRRRRETGV